MNFIHFDFHLLPLSAVDSDNTRAKLKQKKSPIKEDKTYIDKKIETEEGKRGEVVKSSSSAAIVLPCSHNFPFDEFLECLSIIATINLNLNPLPLTDVDEIDELWRLNQI
jgi:hypothetical protein